MTRTKSAIAALVILQAEPAGPPWLELLMLIGKLGLSAYLVWYLFSDTEPRETYTKRVAARRVRMDRP